MPDRSIDRRSLRVLAQRVWDEYASSRCDATVSIVPVGKIKELHRSYFGSETATDVISFNLGAGPHRKVVVDVYICAEMAAENARRYGCTFANEIARLAVHGMLHAAGFEDDTPSQKKAMRALEDKFLETYSA